MDNKKTKLSVTTNNTVNTSTQTPIEVALQIDENGMTTASNLYAFLELEPKNFSHWCTRNIKNNKFAVENEDYEVFVFENENPQIGGRPKTDYKITADFAKKLSMTGNTERHEQARQYFIACEQGLKIAMQKLQSNNDDILSIAESLTDITQAVNTLAHDVANLQKDVKKLLQAQEKNKATKHMPSPWYMEMLPKFNILAAFYKCTKKELFSSLYSELEDYVGVDLNKVFDKYCQENHLQKDDCYVMDAIEDDEQLREALTSLVTRSLSNCSLQLGSNSR